VLVTLVIMDKNVKYITVVNTHSIAHWYAQQTERVLRPTLVHVVKVSLDLTASYVMWKHTL